VGFYLFTCRLAEIYKQNQGIKMGAYFELILVILVIASGVIAGLDKWVFAKHRDKEAKPPLLAEYARSLFSVFLIVLVIRTFIVEPFKIPSGSMLPGLKVGDFIVVNKFSYALRWPLWHGEILKTGTPERGDVVVLHYPVNPQIDFIKRIVALPGDRVSYIDKQLFVNGKPVVQKVLGPVIDPVNSSTQDSTLLEEIAGDKTYQIYNLSWMPAVDFRDVVVPAGEYFVMGDNRDNSDDSRFWGLVPADDLVGKAVLIWFSWDGDKHTVRWNQLGKVVH
jgi:signal peptidase I